MRWHRAQGRREAIPAFEHLESRLLLDATSPFPTDPLPGQDLVRPYDVNYDGRVDGGDLSTWQQCYDPLGHAGVTYFDGDLSADGRVDGGDLALWQQNYDPLETPRSGEYAWFNDFSTDNFGAEIEPLVYEKFGDVLHFIASGDWKRTSVEAATIAFETNLPARTYVQFGETTAYGRMSIPSERPFYVHAHLLRDLSPQTTYHYRLVAVDERGNALFSEDRTFATKSYAGKIQVPGGHLSIPMDLTSQNATYILTGDIVADSTAFNIRADDITLDLNGYTITYDNVPHAADPTADQGLFGYFGVLNPHGTRNSWNTQGLQIFNGAIVQGPGNSGYGSAPVYTTGMSVLAGMTLVYQGSQVTGVWGSVNNAHHNIVLDRGTEITNRHQGIDAFDGNIPQLHHNLIKRVRHRGINAYSNTQTYHNEICVDSWDTNSYGVMYYAASNATFHHNKVMGTGYMVIGVGTVSDGVADIEVYDNLIQLQAIQPLSRSSEYGDGSGAYGVRTTWGGQDLDYHDNLIVTNARDGGRVRGIWYCPDVDLTNNVYRDNVVKAIAENTSSTIHGAIVISGSDSTLHAPVRFIGNRVISNFCNVVIGEPYGYGSNVQFIDTTFERVGTRSDYRTIEIGYWNRDHIGHRFIDSTFVGGASYDLVLWEGTGTRNFTVEWTLTVNTHPGAQVTVTDAFGTTVFTGVANVSGQVSTVLVQYLHEPTGKTFHTAHDVRVDYEGDWATQVVTMDQVLEIDLFTGLVAIS